MIVLKMASDSSYDDGKRDLPSDATVASRNQNKKEQA
jgi:hypothetical protein